jgi:ABC-type multidrug transport system fused ATPase/permease subunit
LRIRTAIIIAIYKKSLLLSLNERHRRGGAGQIATLVGIDAQRLQDLLTYLHAVWYSFFQIGVAMYFLWGQLGVSCLAGLIVIILMIPTTNVVGRYQGKIQKTLMKARDERTALNSEMLSSMKVIKIQAWEEDFRTKLLHLRSIELDRLWQYFITSGISVTMYSAAPLLVALATFAAYTMLGETLDVATALTALALFDIIRFPMIMFPQIVNSIVEAGISLERIREFLLAEEYTVVGEGTLKEKGEVWMNNGTFVYDSKKPIFDNTDSGNIKGLLQQHQRMMKEAQYNERWEMILLKAQLVDAEDTIRSLENKVVRPGREEKWSPSSLLSLRRVCMQCQPGEFVAIVGGVGAGKVSAVQNN